jgi:thymidylate kinase
VTVDSIVLVVPAPTGTTSRLLRGRRRNIAFTVALVGVDGAGKTTVARELERRSPIPARYVYMGGNPEAATHLLPTTRLIRAARRARGTSSSGDFPQLTEQQKPPLRRGFVHAAHEAAWIVNRIAEEWYRQLVVYAHLLSGKMVILDRHYYADYYASDIAPGARRSLARAVHGFLLSRIYPRPNLVVFLDAPPAVLLARKGEGTITYLTRRRADYLALGASLRNFAIVDATRPPASVASSVLELVQRYVGTGTVADGAAEAHERDA